jgi:hypothetical protein
MRTICFLLLSLAWFTGQAQTKKIAFKSHSGSSANFTVALGNDLFDMEKSDFGLPEKRALDSVILIADSVAVLVSRKESNQNKQWQKKDTLRSTALFSKTNNLDSIKKNIHFVYWFSNSVDSIRFIGFDSTPLKTKRNDLPYFGTINNDNYHPFDGQTFWIMGLIVLLSLMAGLFTWKHKTVQLKQMP